MFSGEKEQVCLEKRQGRFKLTPDRCDYDVLKDLGVPSHFGDTRDE